MSQQFLKILEGITIYTTINALDKPSEPNGVGLAEISDNNSNIYLNISNIDIDWKFILICSIAGLIVLLIILAILIF